MGHTNQTSSLHFLLVSLHRATVNLFKALNTIHMQTFTKQRHGSMRGKEHWI